MPRFDYEPPSRSTPGAATAVASTRRDYYQRLQSFRGFGVLMVAFYHCQGVIGSELPMHATPDGSVGTVQVLAHHLSLMLLNGHAALISFFVLSGFVLTLSLRRGPQAPAPASLAFASGRLFRIIPTNAVAVLVAVAVVSIARAWPDRLIAYDWQRLVANMLLVDNSINPVAWSLTVELLAIPFILGMYVLTSRRGPAPLTAASALAIVLSFAPAWLGYRPLGRNLFAVFFGMLVAQHGPRVGRALTRRQAAGWFLAVLAVWFLARAALGRWSHWASLLEAGAAASMMLMLVYGPEFSAYRAFELRPILWLGEISFSLYLYHAVLWPWLAPSYDGLWPGLGPWRPLAAVAVSWAVTVGLVIPIAWLSYQLIERPSIAAGRLVTRRWDRAGRVVAARRPFQSEC